MLAFVLLLIGTGIGQSNSLIANGVLTIVSDNLPKMIQPQAHLPKAEEGSVW